MFNLKSSLGTHTVQESKDSSYSTEEVNTGTTWIDGSTIYKKTIVYENTALSSSFKKEHGISNVNKIIKGQYILQADDGGTVLFPDITNSGKGLKFDASQVYIQGRGNDSWAAMSSRKFYATLWYTKTN